MSVSPLPTVASWFSTVSKISGPTPVCELWLNRPPRWMAVSVPVIEYALVSVNVEAPYVWAYVAS